MNEKYTWILAGTYTISFFSLIILFHFFPEITDANIQGRLTDGEFMILSWAFGSSVGSRMKDNVISNQTKDKE